jgi:hypothetical protein
MQAHTGRNGPCCRITLSARFPIASIAIEELAGGFRSYEHTQNFPDKFFGSTSVVCEYKAIQTLIFLGTKESNLDIGSGNEAGI